MFKHLKYIDGSSDKFWQIETSGSSHTVTYGRNGTDGQSKTKDFDSEEACLKDAEKLVNEKTKKGYSEDGSVTVGHNKSTDGTPAKKSSSALKKEEIIDAFYEIIKRANKDGIVPFLEEYASGNLELLRKELRAAKKYYLSYVNLTNEPQFRNQNHSEWGMRGTKNQQYVISLLALGILNQTEANSWFELLDVLNDTKNQKLNAVLEFAKPTWIGEYLLVQTRRNNWASIKYWNLRYLEEKGYISFIPELYALTIPTFFTGYSTDVSERALEKICTDETALNRDIPLLFEYETSFNGVNYNYNQKTQTSDSLWRTVFAKILKEGKMDKETILRGSLEAQTKNWNANLKSFFRELIVDLQPEDDLLIKEQHLFFPLLHAEQTGAINFAINTLKPLLSHQDFDIQEFLSWIEPVFMRVDMKGGVKTLIIQLDKLLKDKPELRDQVSTVIADTFMIPDLQLQERAAKFLLKHQSVATVSVQEKLAMYAGQMLGAISQDLKPLMGAVETYYTEEEILAGLTGSDQEVYQYEPLEVKKLTTEIHIPSNWNDILFQLGQFIHSNDPLDMEILLNAWTIHLKDFPDDFKKQLEPYINKLKKTYSESAFFEIFSSVFINYYHKPDKNYSLDNNFVSKSKTVLLLNDLLSILQNRWRSGTSLPLLSFPTHKPFWIDPSILIDRILLYEEKGEEINPLDLSIALSRTVRENGIQIENKLDQIKDVAIKDLLKFALGFDKQINIGNKNWLSKLVGHLDKEDIWIGVWATAARTHYPNEVFEEFESTRFKSAPFAVKPFEMIFETKPHTFQQMNWQTRKTEELFLGNQIQYDFSALARYPNTFLYALEIFNRGRDRDFAYYLNGLDIPYVYSISPQYPESVCLFYTLHLNNMAVWSSKSSKALLEQMLYPFFKMDEYAVWYLATCLFNQEKEVRATAVELLIQLIEQNRLPTVLLGEKIKFLLNNEFGPIGRLSDILEQCKDISAKHNHAILQILANAFEEIEIKNKMPTNFKKLVELFYDLQHKTNWILSEKLIKAFKDLEGYKSLQPILKKITK